MRVKFKKTNPFAVVPSYAVPGDACMDLYSTSVTHDEFGNVVYDTGIAIEIPSGYVGLLFPRSSISKTTMMLRNSVGVIDSGFRGSIKLKFKSLTERSLRQGRSDTYNVGDRVGQIMLIERPNIEFEEVDELTPTTRGSGSFGSTGS